MAGRILPVALAVIAGVSIGVATFDGEFKEQRRKRLEAEYKRDLDAVSSLNSEGPSFMASSAVRPPAPAQLPPDTETAKTSAFSTLLGTWAWQKSEGAAAVAKEGRSMDGSSEKPKHEHER